MNKEDKSSEILSNLLKDIKVDDNKDLNSKEDNCNASEDNKYGSYNNSKASSEVDFHEKNNAEDKGIPSFEALKAQKGVQNLSERKKLLSILKSFLLIQMIFMNVVILIIVLWVVLRLPFFQSIENDILVSVIDLLKYYVTATLVELLGGIVFVVHQVFTDKTIDSMKKK